jgi:uncharacterized membrane protein
MTTKPSRPASKEPRTVQPATEGAPTEELHTEGPRSEDAALRHNVSAIAELESRALHERSTADRISDGITRVAGSAAFAVANAAFFAGWIAVNAGVIPGIEPFDAFPFSFLTLIVSLEAIFLTLFVLMSQNRMSRQADKRAHLDLQVDLLAEQELTAILQMVKGLCKKLDVPVIVRDQRIDELLKKTDIHQVADALDEGLPKA